MLENEIRLRNLSAKAIEGTIADDEFAELMQLSKAKRKLQDDRTAMLAQFKETIQKHGITLQDLFPDAEIAASSNFNKQISVSARDIKLKQLRNNKKSGLINYKNGPVLIEVNNLTQPGTACRYCMGQTLPYYVSKAWKNLDDGHLEVNLAHHYTTLGQEYFLTTDGVIELTRLLNYIKTHQVKPHLK